MSWLLEVRRGLDGLILLSARTSQAAVIEALDRAAGGRGARAAGKSHGLFSRLVNAQLDVLEVCLGDPASLADEPYDTAARLLNLHREFVQRLFEALDTRDATVFLAGAERLAPVVHLDRTRSRRG